MNKYVYEGQLKSAAYKDASEFAPSSHSHAAKDLSFSEKNTNYTNASNIQDAIEDIDGKLWEIEGAAEEAETNAKAYADSIKNSLLNGAGAAYDTLKELGELIDENHDAITVLEQVATNKADKAEVEALKTQVTATSLILADAITGQKYEIQIQNGQLVSFPVEE